MEREVISIENGKMFIPGNVEIWMTQHEIADLMQCFVAKVNANVRSILKSGVLDETKVCRTHTYKNGNSVELYNLEMIIALAFRIRSYNADAFREFIVRKVIAETLASQIFVYNNWNQGLVLN
jgi:Virulence protein